MFSQMGRGRKRSMVSWVELARKARQGNRLCAIYCRTLLLLGICESFPVGDLANGDLLGHMLLRREETRRE